MISPHRIVILKPCCLGDVINATPLLAALHRAYPQASIDWAVGSAAINAIKDHPALRQVLDTGGRANPASRPRDLWRLVRMLRTGRYDLLVVPDRSPLYSLAALLSGIPHRAGLDSTGRGFGYTIKAPIDPQVIRHEADIYLDVARALQLEVSDCWVNAPPTAAALATTDSIIRERGLTRFVMVHPGGGVNAGMHMPEKRWLPDRFAQLAERVATQINGQIVVIGAGSDAEVVQQFKATLTQPVVDLSQQLNLPDTAALASRSSLYIGNDNGVAHLAAAAGAPVLMIFGPSDPRRYAPFVPPDRGGYAWRPVVLPAAGVAAGNLSNFDWTHGGVSVDEAWQQAQPLLRSTS